jgi:hypothetical protein
LTKNDKAFQTSTLTRQTQNAKPIAPRESTPTAVRVGHACFKHWQPETLPRPNRVILVDAESHLGPAHLLQQRFHTQSIPIARVHRRVGCGVPNPTLRVCCPNHCGTKTATASVCSPLGIGFPHFPDLDSRTSLEVLTDRPRLRPTLGDSPEALSGVIPTQPGSIGIVPGRGVPAAVGLGSGQRLARRHHRPQFPTGPDRSGPANGPPSEPSHQRDSTDCLTDRVAGRLLLAFAVLLRPIQPEPRAGSRATLA